jgi:hypothetical protein
MDNKLEKECRSAIRLSEWLRANSGSEWIVRRGPDPPDFVFAQVGGANAVEMAVEHTSLSWPPLEIAWALTLRAVLDSAANAVRDRVEGMFGFGIQHLNLDEFERDYAALSRARRRAAIEGMTQELLTKASAMNVGEPLILQGPPTGTLTRFTTDGPIDIGITKMLSRGDYLGYGLRVNVETGGLTVFRTEQANSLLTSLEDTLTKKAERLQVWTGGPRILLVDDWSAGRSNLIWLAKLVTIPQGIDGVYIYSLRDQQMLDFKGLISGIE